MGWVRGALRRFRHQRWLVRCGLIVLLLLPFGLVEPLSYFPNPVGLYYFIGGGYTYTPGSRFVNRFALLGSGDPTAQLERELARLLGKTGLDPLDPVQPLAGYRLTGVLARPRGIQRARAAADVEFRYADGSTRAYRIPVAWPLPEWDRDDWRLSGLGRLLAVHEELPWLPFAAEETAIGLGAPTRLALPGSAAPLATAPLWSPTYIGWGGGTATHGNLRALPDGSGFLLLQPQDSSPYASEAPVYRLWLVGTGGDKPREIADDVTNAAASADGRHVVYTRAIATPDYRRVEVYDRGAAESRRIGHTDVAQAAVAGGYAYLLDFGDLWRVALATGARERLGALPGASGAGRDAPGTALAVSPDGARVAYRCGADACLADTGGANVVRQPLGHRAENEVYGRLQDSFGLAWSPDGRRLAITVGALHPGVAAPKIRILNRGGVLLHELALGPHGTAWAPEWTPDGRFVFLNAFPRGGRRIVAVDTAAGQVADLSRPGWDAHFTLAAGGDALLLWNGRGSFWTVPLQRR